MHKFTKAALKLAAPAMLAVTLLMPNPSLASGSLAEARAARGCNGACHSTGGGSGDARYYFWEAVHATSPSLGHWALSLQKKGPLAVRDNGGSIRPMARPKDMSQSDYKRYLKQVQSLPPRQRNSQIDEGGARYDADGDLRPGGY